MSLVPKPKYHACETGEIICLHCVGKEKCTKYASRVYDYDVNHPNNLHKPLVNVTENNHVLCPHCSRSLSIKEIEADNSTPGSPVQAMQFWCPNCKFEEIM